jgi:hypothetical protein
MLGRTYLNLGLEHEMRITGISQSKNASKLIDSQIADIPDFELWRLGAHLQFDDLDLICNDGGFATFIESIIEHVNCIGVELGAEAGPFKGE